MRRVDRLIPPELAREPGSQLRARALVGTCFGLAGLVLVTLIVRIATVPFDGTLIVAATFIAVVLSVPFVQWAARSHKLAGAALVTAMIAALVLVHALHGTFPEPSLLVSPLMPLAGVFLVGLGFGLVSSGVLAAAVVALKLMLPPPSGEQVAVQSWTFAAVAAVAPLICVLIAAAYERAHRRGQLELEAANLRSVEAFARAEAANRSKTEFLRNVSHELRTPLNAIMGFGALAEEQARAAGHAEIVADVSQIGRASEQLLALINDLLDVSRIEADVVELELGEVDLGELLTQVCEVARPLVLANDNTIEIDVAAGLPRIVTDERRVRQVLLNLVSNACKFTEHGQIYLIAAASPMGVVLGVRDTGIGMSADQRARIFEPFVQVHPSAQMRQQGTGLGLALSRGLVGALGGEIEVRSEPGRGTEFTVRLPRALTQ